jgi:hypothetical protein
MRLPAGPCVSCSQSYGTVGLARLLKTQIWVGHCQHPERASSSIQPPGSAVQDLYSLVTPCGTGKHGWLQPLQAQRAPFGLFRDRVRTCSLLPPKNESAYSCRVFFFFFVGLGFEFRALCSQSRHSTAYATPPVHFALVILMMGVSWTTFLGLEFVILLISVSQVSRITGASHWHLDSVEFWYHIKEEFLQSSKKLLKYSLCQASWCKPAIPILGR